MGLIFIRDDFRAILKWQEKMKLPKSYKKLPKH